MSFQKKRIIIFEVVFNFSKHIFTMHWALFKD